MTRQTLPLDDSLYEYLLANSLREHPELAALREATRTHPRASMQIAPEQGQLMALLVKLLGARRTIEVGVFTGYSALAVALALPDDGRIL
ncbi:MAG: SAM-dependent methyltransferase, partial [Burkholderiaceae bacterium]|nr:SAM-dependent methyltransferase [Burkholderiaceae bacterium]